MPTVLSNCQQQALDAFIDFIDSDEPWMIISGFAGSGKSFLVEYMADIAENKLKVQQHLNKAYRPPTLLFTATTNKAAAVLADMLGRETRTIHSLLHLKLHTNYTNGKQRLVQSSSAKGVTNSIIFIDESSMVNRELMHYIEIYQKHTSQCKLVFIGDSYQLPPINEGPCNVFNATDRHFFLDEIQRQVAGSPIIKLSAKYREVLDDPEIPWPRIPSDNQNIFFYDTEPAFRTAIQASMGSTHNSQEHKVLAWQNDTVRDYNKWIRGLHGYHAPFELNEVMMSNKPLMAGKRIMSPTDSLHRITDIEDGEEGHVKGYFITLVPVQGGHNGVRAFQPEDWRQAKRLMKVFADDKDWQNYYHIKEQWADLRPIHALTVHKAQGSTYKEVFVDLSDIGRNTRWQECARLAYVAVTRASTRLHVYGSIGTDHSNTKKRNTLLEKFNVDHLL
jgi:exodeoxyribonuclease-5